MDLAGHERYFKTTAYGLTGHLPGAAAVLAVAAERRGHGAERTVQGGGALCWVWSLLPVPS